MLRRPTAVRMNVVSGSLCAAILLLLTTGLARAQVSLPGPSLLLPTDGGAATSSAPSFSWLPVSGASLGYRIMAATTPDVLPSDPTSNACPACAIDATTQLTAYVHAPGLSANTTYYWQVRAVAGPGQSSAWSTHRLFTTTGTDGVIQISSPQAGATASDPLVAVEGLLAIPAAAEVGVTVNGVVGFTHLAKFSAMVPVDPSVTVLTATATDTAGRVLARHAIPVTVAAPPAALPVTLTVSPVMGTAPVSAVFTMTEAVPILAVTLDADGNGAPDFAGRTVSGQTFTYNLPGLYRPTLTAVDTAGQTHTAVAMVRVFAAGELDQLLQPKWEAMKSELRAGDIDGALSYVSLARRSAYRSMLSNLSIPLGSIDQVLTNISFARQLSRHADFDMMRTEAGTPYSHLVVFVYDEDGIWRLRFF